MDIKLAQDLSHYQEAVMQLPGVTSVIRWPRGREYPFMDRRGLAGISRYDGFEVATDITDEKHILKLFLSERWEPSFPVFNNTPPLTLLGMCGEDADGKEAT